jgi:hypothetical protein
MLRQGDTGADVSRLQRLLAILGHDDSPIDGDFGPKTDRAVRSFQKSAGLKVDGLAGPDTWERLEELVLDGELPLETVRHAWRERNSAELEVAAAEHVPLPGPSSSGPAGESTADGLEAALARADEEWRRPVVEPKGRGWERIDEYIRGPQGLEWTWESRYTRNQQFAWCGAFAAFCLEAAGLKADLRNKVMPSTYRLHRWASNTPRFVQPDSVARGDIVIVGPATGRVWGSHITLCDTVEGDGWLRTIEGNARGEGPDGSRYEGVIRQRRPLAHQAQSPATYRVLYGIRLLAGDVT